MPKVLNRIQSGNFAESLVFAQLSLLGHTVKFAKKNQVGYDLKIATPLRKIEVKHIQYTGVTGNDSFVLSKLQVAQNSFDFLVLIVSDCTLGNRISKIDYYIFSHSEIRSIIISNKGGTILPKNYTFNLSKNGLSLASTPLLPYHNQWNKI